MTYDAIERELDMVAPKYIRRRSIKGPRWNDEVLDLQ